MKSYELLLKGRDIRNTCAEIISECAIGTNASWQVTIVWTEISDVNLRFHEMFEAYCGQLIRCMCRAVLKLHLFQKVLKPDVAYV